MRFDTVSNTVGSIISSLYSLYVQVEKILCCQKSMDLVSRYNMAILLPMGKLHIVRAWLAGMIFTI